MSDSINSSDNSTVDPTPPSLLPAGPKKIGGLSAFDRAIRLVIIGIGLLGIAIVFGLQLPSADTVIHWIQSIPSTQPSLPTKTTNELTIRVNPDGSKIYPIQHNSLFGYDFYTSKVDQSGNVDIGSAQKQNIARLLIALNLPKSLTTNLAIVNVDPTVLGPHDALLIPWEGVPTAYIALQPEGGQYAPTTNGAVIFLNNLVGYDLSTLTHELGHHIGRHMTDQEWAQFYKLRGIPANLPKNSSNWNLSPDEDFAEVYKAVYKSAVIGSSPYSMGADAWAIRTEFGLLIPSYPGIDMVAACSSLVDNARQSYIDTHYRSDPYNLTFPTTDMLNKADAAANADPKVQVCRRNNNGQSELGGKLYASQVDNATAQFIKAVVARLSGSAASR